MALHFMIDVVNDVVVIYNYVIIAGFKSEPICKLIHRIPGSRLLRSSLP